MIEIVSVEALPPSALFDSIKVSEYVNFTDSHALKKTLSELRNIEVCRLDVFLHAYLIPRRPPTKDERRIKDEAKAIVKTIEGSEEVATTVVHLSEVVNIVETGLGVKESLGFLA